MKILMHADTLGDGYTFAVDLAKSLINTGNEVILALTGIMLTNQQKSELQPLEHYYTEFKSEWMENPWGDIREAGRWLLDLGRKTKPDIVHLNTFSFGNLQWDVPVLMVYHSCMIGWWKALFDKPVPVRWIRYRNMVKRGLQNAYMVVATTNSILNEIEKLYGPFPNSRVIPGGKSSYAYHSDVKERYIFSTGHLWDDARNLDLLLEVAPNVPYPVYIEGDNQHVQTKHLPQNVFCTGPLKLRQRIDWLANAFICVLPSKYEPFGYIFLEAAFSKCALIGSDIRTFREIWHDSMVYFKTSEDLTDAINYLMQNPDQLYLYGQKAYERALENYTIEKMAKHFMNAYQQLSLVSVKQRL